jgi:hypothetical protein
VNTLLHTELGDGFSAVAPNTSATTEVSR